MFDAYPEGEVGKHAITHYKVIERYNYTTLVSCVLETGRTHQIRVHMKHIGHTLFNDAEYGGDRILKGTVYTKYKQFVDNCFEACPRCALHAATLGFVHPTTETLMRFESELPSDIQAAITKWKYYKSAAHSLEAEDAKASDAGKKVK
jgi:23S rRNA pseudouridine1911/1915/1917 synthase